MGAIQLSSDRVKAGASLVASIEVENTSDRDGDEVVQLYTHQRAGSASRPVRELKAFRRVSLKAHERRMVELKLDTNDLSFWSSQTHTRQIEPGIFDLWMGDSSEATEHSEFRVVGAQ